MWSLVVLLKLVNELKTNPICKRIVYHDDYGFNVRFFFLDVWIVSRHGILEIKT